VNNGHYCQVRPTGCFRLQNGCQVHYHATDSVITSVCSFNSQLIWNSIFIVLEIPSICSKIEKFNIWNRGMHIKISGWHTFNVRTLSSNIVTKWCRWHVGQRRDWFGCSCTCCTAPPACLQIICCAILARKAAIHVIFKNDCWLSRHCGLQLFKPWRLDIPHHLLSDFGVKFLD